jgi:hypothetical protein
LTFAWLTDSRDVWMKGLEGIMLRRSPYLDEVRAEMRQQDTLAFLEARFPGAVPAAVVERVRAETDLAVLGRWIQLAGKAESPEAFQSGTG